MPIPARYSPPNHAKSCPYCRLHSTMERDRTRSDSDAADLEPESHKPSAPVVRLLKRIGRLVSKRG